MVATSSLYGGASVTSILAPTDTSGNIATIVAVQSGAAKRVSSGALTATVYKELVSVSTPGWLRFCSVFCVDATARTIGLKIVIDGTTVFDEVSQSISVAGSGFNAAGAGSNGLIRAMEYLRFNSSLSLQIKSSLSETDKVGFQYLVAT